MLTIFAVYCGSVCSFFFLQKIVLAIIHGINGVTLVLKGGELKIQKGWWNLQHGSSTEKGIGMQCFRTASDEFLLDSQAVMCRIFIIL